VGLSAHDTLDLATLLADPPRARDVSIEAIPSLLAQLAAEQAQLAAVGMALAARLSERTDSTDGDHLLTVDQAAERLGTTRDWLRRRPELPFTVRLSAGQVRYSAKGIDRFIARRTGARGVDLKHPNV